MADQLETADGSETIAGADLQPSIDALEALAVSMDADIDTAADVDAVQAIGAAQVKLRNREQDLIDAQIKLLAGQVKLTADHINAATQFAKDTVSKIADWKTKVAKAGAVVDFLGVCLTGDGFKILGAAVSLKKALSS
jgi:hypothetical protein